MVALHDSRHREAKRIIRNSQHLLGPLADAPIATGSGSSEPSRSRELGKLAGKVLVAALVALIIAAHGFALHEMHSAAQAEQATGMPPINGD